MSGSDSSSGGNWGNTPDPNHSTLVRPIILNLDGNGIQITDLTQSTTYVDGGDGLEHRTAWARAGDGILFYDPEDTGEITEMRQYVFTEWDPTATSDMEALASVFDTNGDGELLGAELADFRVMVTNADGTTTSHTLTALGITSINLTADATNIVLPDGSTGKVANSSAKCWEYRMLRVHAA